MEQLQWYSLAQASSHEGSCRVDFSIGYDRIIFDVKIQYGTLAINIAKASISSDVAFAIRLRSSGNTTFADIRCSSYLTDIPQFTVLSQDKDKSFTATDFVITNAGTEMTIIEDVQGFIERNGGTGSQIDIITSAQLSRKETDTNVYSALRTKKEIQKLTDDIDSYNSNLTQQINKSVENSETSYKDAVDAIAALKDAVAKDFTNFTESVTPISVQTMGLLVGSENLQFRFIKSKTEIVATDSGITFDGSTRQLAATERTIQHMTLGIDSLSNDHDASEYKYWLMSSFSIQLSADDDDKGFYLYAKCSKSKEEGTYVISSTAIGMEDVDGYYHLLVGWLNRVYSGSRSFAPFYGFTQILPGRVVTDKIISSDSAVLIDLVNKIVRLSDLLTFWRDNDGVYRLRIKGGIVQSSGGEDSAITCYRGAYGTTKTYYNGDTVTYSVNGVKSTYRYIYETGASGIAPTDTTHWDIVAEGVKGDQGIQGLQGIQGETGEQGIAGTNGSNGQTSYFHVKYSDNADGTNMNENGGLYIGTYVDFTEADSTDKTKYTWVLVKGSQGDKGDQGIAGTNGSNGQTSYLHIAYANSADGATGFSVSVYTDKLYIGQYTDFTQADSTDYTKYKWTKIKGDQGIQGLQGIQGDKGEQGIAGTNGSNGQTSYFHVKYSDNADGTNMNENGGLYIGTYVDFTEADSTDKTKYTWVLVKGSQGDKGDQGIAGTNGSNGQTSYLHIAYANSADGATGFSVSVYTDKLYIGQYTDFTQADSTDYTKYKWTKIKGDQGIQGLQGIQGDKGEQGIAGTNGSNGQTSYFHVKYSDNADGTNMNENGGLYIGTYVDFTEADSTDKTKYTWVLVKGSQGDKGDQGIAGTNGSNGQTSYLHIAYANSADGATGFSVSVYTDKLYIGQYTDFTQADSTDYTKYKWTKIKGDQGIQGLQGIQGDRGEQGIAGTNGSNGQTSYFHVKYSDNADGTNMNENGGLYIGTYVDFTEADSTDKTKYTWVLVKGSQGDKGDQGIAGTNGSNGQTSYLHIAYANSADGATGFSVSVYTDKLYIGQYTDFTQADSTDYTKYKWTKIKGDQGIQGLQGIQGDRGEQGIAGTNGSNGQTSYFHVKYSDNADGTNMNENGGLYIGTYVDFTEADSTDKTKYTWVLVKGSQGDKGDQGIAGTNGSNGQTSYLHIAYANSADGATGFSVSVYTDKLYIGQYTDFTQADSTDYTKYKWTKIKGETGTQGDKGDKGDTGATGNAGPAIIYRGTYSSTKKYTGNSRRVDVVKYTSSAGTLFYVCNSDAGDITGIAPTDTAHWSYFGAEFESVATQLLIAASATLGELHVDDGGKITLRTFDGTNYTDKVIMSSADIESLSDLLGSGTSSSGTTTAAQAESLTNTGNSTTNTTVATVVIPTNGTKLTVTGQTITCTNTCASYIAKEDFSEGKIEVLDSAGNVVACVLDVLNDDCELKTNTTVSQTVNGFTIYLNAGTYTIRAAMTYNCSYTDNDMLISVASGTWSYVYDATKKRVVLGGNGIAAFFDKNNYAYMAYDSQESEFKLDMRGACYIPGILYAGIVTASTSGASISKIFGELSCTVSRNSQGVYTITHNLSHTNYIVIAIPYVTSTSIRMDYDIAVTNHYSNNIVVRTSYSDSQSIIDISFQFVIIGNRKTLN